MGNSKYDNFMNGLREHLQKSEIEYIASHGGGYPETFKWESNIEDHARRIGFRVKEHFEADGEFIRTTSGIAIDLHSGFVCK